MAGAEERYRAALQLYRTTDLSVREICAQTGNSVRAFQAFLQRNHRPLMLARHGIKVSPEDAPSTKVRKQRGQSPKTHAKYKDAILACDDSEYIACTISEIARIFHLSPTGLSNQLRSHFSDILIRREKERLRLGINDNRHRGMKQSSREQYADAVDHLRNSDDSIRQTAALFSLSYPALREHLLAYHKELVDKRLQRRKQAEGSKERGRLTGNGQRHLPSEEQIAKYEHAVQLYRTSGKTQEEIAKATGISLAGLRNYLRAWNRDVIAERQEATAVKYADAITELKEAVAGLKKEGLSTAQVARKYGFQPDIFREYLYAHQPELAARLGMSRMPDGKLVRARSAEKYEEAIRLFASTTENLKSIAGRLGLQYKSLSSFIKRNRPDALEAHRKLLSSEILDDFAHHAPDGKLIVGGDAE